MYVGYIGMYMGFMGEWRIKWELKWKLVFRASAFEIFPPYTGTQSEKRISTYSQTETGIV